jgi:hypothetical protein
MYIECFSQVCVTDLVFFSISHFLGGPTVFISAVCVVSARLWLGGGGRPLQKGPFAPETTTNRLTPQSRFWTGNELDS